MGGAGNGGPAKTFDRGSGNVPVFVAPGVDESGRLGAGISLEHRFDRQLFRRDQLRLGPDAGRQRASMDDPDGRQGPRPGRRNFREGGFGKTPRRSFLRHGAEARWLGFPLRVVREPLLGRDVDVPGDLAAVSACT